MSPRRSALGRRFLAAAACLAGVGALAVAARAGAAAPPDTAAAAAPALVAPAASAPATPVPSTSAPRSTDDPTRRQQPVGSLPGQANRALTIIGGIAAVVVVVGGGLTFRWFAKRGERAGNRPST